MSYESIFQSVNFIMRYLKYEIDCYEWNYKNWYFVMNIMKMNLTYHLNNSGFKIWLFCTRNHMRMKILWIMEIVKYKQQNSNTFCGTCFISPQTVIHKIKQKKYSWTPVYQKLELCTVGHQLGDPQWISQWVLLHTPPARVNVSSHLKYL